MKKSIYSLLFFLLLSPLTLSAKESLVGSVDHVGLTVSNLEASKNFFENTLGFSIIREDNNYPSAFLSNGKITVTLWRTTDPSTATAFNRKNNVGLHHLAFKIDSFKALDDLYHRLKATPGIKIEFSPEPLAGGPTKHMMIREPSGNRLEFIHRPMPTSH